MPISQSIGSLIGESTESYTTLGSWIEANGNKITGPSREVYLSPPVEDGTATTEIQFPVEQA